MPMNVHSAPLCLFCLLLCSCQSAYYGALEKFGVHKRDILVERVEEAREAQEDAKEQFESAFESFLAVSEVDVAELKETYDRLRAAFERSESRATEVRARVGAIQGVAKALFKEWEGELEQYASAELRSLSGQKLEETRLQSESLIAAMQAAAAKMDPVLDAFRDQVLFLKHNLNAQAVAALSATTLGLRDEVEVLIREMEASIQEANAFVAQMRSA